MERDTTNITKKRWRYEEQEVYREIIERVFQ